MHEMHHHLSMRIPGAGTRTSSRCLFTQQNQRDRPFKLATALGVVGRPSSLRTQGAELVQASRLTLKTRARAFELVDDTHEARRMPEEVSGPREPTRA